MSIIKGFGIDGNAEHNRFVVVIDEDKGMPVHVYLDYGFHHSSDDGTGKRVLRAIIERSRWDMIADAARVAFNVRLRSIKRDTGRWSVGETPVELLLGKELVLLAWGTEDAPVDKIEQAIKNWSGLQSSERWWLYTTTAAATGDAVQHRGIGWRRAVMIALTENPV